MSVEEVFVGAKEVGGEFIDFLVRPDQFADRMLIGKVVKRKTAVSWSVATIVLVLGIYSLTSPRTPPAPSKKENVISPEPRIDEIRWNLQPRLEFLEEVRADDTRVLVLSFGAVTTELVGLDASAVTKSSLVLAMLVLYSISVSLCLYPVAALLGTRKRFKTSFSFAISILSLSALQITLVTSLLLVLRERYALGDDAFWVAWSVLAALPWIVTTGRAYFLGFARIFAFSRRRMLAAVGGAIMASMFVGPLVYLPGLWLILLCREWLEVLV